MQRSAKTIDSAEMRLWFIVYASMNSPNLYTATRSIRKMEAVQVAEKVLLGALEQLKRVQLFVERAEDRYWRECAQYKSNHSVATSASEPIIIPSKEHINKSVQCELYASSSLTSLKSVSASVLNIQVSQDGLATPPNLLSPRVHTPSEECAEGGESRESDSPPSPLSRPSPRAQVLALKATEWDNAVTLVRPPSPRAYTTTEVCVEGDESRESDSPPSPPSLPTPRAYVTAIEPIERDRLASPERTLGSPNPQVKTPACVTAEEGKLQDLEKPRKKRSKECILKLTRLEEEPKRKKPKGENRFILLDKQLNLSIPAEILVNWITWLWTRPATRGIEFKNPSAKKVKTGQTAKITNDRKKKTTKSIETEEEREKRRERDRIRKREQRKKQKEEALKIKKGRVPLVRADVSVKTAQHTTIPQAPLFTLCTECKEDCWYKGEGLHDLPWLLCVVCHTNWANGRCGGRVPYECRICRLKKARIEDRLKK